MVVMNDSNILRVIEGQLISFLSWYTTGTKYLLILTHVQRTFTHHFNGNFITEIGV